MVLWNRWSPGRPVTLVCMDLWRESERLLNEINAEWERAKEPVLIRYFQIVPDLGDMDGWVLLPVVEMQGDGEVEEQSSYEERRRYETMVRDRVSTEPFSDMLLVICRFRTSKELEDPGHQMGAPLTAA